MVKFKTRLFLSVLIVVLFTSLSYLFFLLHISDYILGLETVADLQVILILLGLAVTSFAVLASIFTCVLLDRGISGPLKRISRAQRALIRGSFKEPLKTDSYIEIAELTSSFNQMVEQIKKFKEDRQRQSYNLEKIIRERNRGLSYIYKIGREISATLELTEVLDTIVKRIPQVLEVKTCVVLLVDENASDVLTAVCARGLEVERIRGEQIRKGEAISGWVSTKAQPLLVKSLEQDTRFLARKKERYYSGSLISVPLQVKDRVIGIINAAEKSNGGIFKKDDLLLLKEIAIEAAIAVENALLYKSLKGIYLHTISALASTLEAKDYYARSHSENVTRYALAIAQTMKLDSTQTENIRQACWLHDLGKIGIHDYILTKSGKLSPKEWAEIKLHSLKGADIVQKIGSLNEVAALVKQHHERYDGKGYPSALKGRQISLGARIMAVADAFDAMISKRPYRRALSLRKAVKELKDNSSSQFDPEIVKIFLKILETNPEIVKKVKKSS